MSLSDGSNNSDLKSPLLNSSINDHVSTARTTTTSTRSSHYNSQNSSRNTIYFPFSINNKNKSLKKKNFINNIILILIIIIFFLIPLLICNDIEGYLLWGSVLTLGSTINVIYTWFKNRQWRRHPAPLIFWRSIANGLFGLLILFDSLNLFIDHGIGCKTLSFLTNLALLASETWLLFLTIDFLSSLKNPFSSYQLAMKQYHGFTWTLGIILSIILITSDSCQGMFINEICWVAVSGPLCPCFWGFFFAWAILYYIGCIIGLLQGYNRIKIGLEQTMRTRKRVLEATMHCVISYIIYLTLLVLLYCFWLLLDPSGNDDKSNNITNFLEKLLAFIFASRGVVDLIVWKVIHNKRYLAPKHIKNITSPISSNNFFSSTSYGDTVRNRNKNKSKAGVNTTWEDSTTNEIYADDIDIDLAPHLNMALRHEVLHYVTLGIKNAINNDIDDYTTTSSSFCSRSDRPPSFNVSFSSQVPDYNTPTKYFNYDNDIEKLNFLLDERYLFASYLPSIFKEIRYIDDIDDESYLTHFSATAGERLSEGGSGSFLFYSKDNKLICKTVTKEESDFLHSFSNKFLNFLKNNKNSLISRIYGSYSIDMYNKTFYFVVMNNVLSTSYPLNARYDIKGSWINRSHRELSPGQKSFCRHCNEIFKIGSRKKCPEVIGFHEPNVILKDNDLTTKIRLRPDESFQVIEQLFDDSDFLCSLGIMDYSLLIGVRNFQYDVDPTLLLSNNNKNNESFIFYPTTNKSPRPYKSESSTPDITNFNSETDNIDNLQLPSSILNNNNNNNNNRVNILSPVKEVDCEDINDSINEEKKDEKIDKNLNNNDLQYIDDKKDTIFEIREHLVDDIDDSSWQDAYPARAVIGPGLYYLGLVDILQTWTWRKKLERFFKVYIKRVDGNGISCVDPIVYKKRFQAKVMSIIEHSVFIRQVTSTTSKKTRKSNTSTISNNINDKKEKKKKKKYSRRQTWTGNSESKIDHII